MTATDQNIKLPEGFSQVCIWEGTTVLNNDPPVSIESFEELMLEQFQSRVKYLEEIKTFPTPGDPDSGGRNDLLFAIHDEDILKFAIPRLTVGIRWIEDVLVYNNHSNLYPSRLKEYVRW